MSDIVTRIVDEHYRKSNAEFWWAEASRAKAEMALAESRLGFVWARERERVALWNMVTDASKPDISAVFVNLISQPFSIELVYQ